MRRGSFPVSNAWLNVAVCFGVFALLIGSILRRLHGSFSYGVDDAYIHLALTQRIAHGLYGINVGEAASPSSSLLWPLLFVPFGRTHLLLILPLIVNVVCSCATAYLLGLIVERALGPQQARPLQSRCAALLLSVLMLLGLNTFGLALLGLEHSLEVLLSVACAAGLLQIADSRRAPWWAIAAALLLPSVRYEGVLIALCFSLASWLVGQRRIAAVTLFVGVAPLVLFGLFLRHLGLPFAPMSVLAKSTALFRTGAPRPADLVHIFKGTLMLHLRDPERFSVLILLCALTSMAWWLRARRPAMVVAAAGALACFGHFYVGPYGWLYRYEIYCIGFSLPLAVGLAIRFQRCAAHQDQATERSVPGGVLVAVGCLALFYITPLLGAPEASAAVWEQQGQIGRFTRDFYHGPVGLHDLGWIAVQRPAGEYTMDFEGLGSYEAFRVRGHATPDVLAYFAREHHISLAILNPTWFAGGLPPAWKPLAKLCADPAAMSFGQVSPSMVFWATPEGDAVAITGELEAFGRTLPATVPFQLHPADLGPCR